MLRWTAFAGALIALCLVVLTPAQGAREGSTAPSAAAPLPPYLTSNGASVEVHANKQWGAKEVHVNFQANETDALVWAAACSRGEQTVGFRRKLTLPGPGADGQFTITPFVGSAWLSNPPLRSWELAVNGKVVANGRFKFKPSAKSFDIKLSKAQMAAFRFGPNEVEVTVTKGPSPASVPKCNTTAENRLSVQFILRGRFVSDLALVDTPPAKQYRRAAAELSQIINLTVRNQGPSGILAGQFGLDICCPTSFAVLSTATTSVPGIAPLGRPFTGCEVDDSKKPTYKVLCGLADFKAKDRAILTVGFQTGYPNTAFSESYTNLQWTVGTLGITDANFENNSRGVQFVWCGTLATSDGCKNASG